MPPRPSKRSVLFGVAGLAVAPAGMALVLRRGSQAGAFQAGLWADLSRIETPPSAERLKTSGYDMIGRGAGEYVVDPDQRSSGQTPWRSRDASGRWWVLAELRPTYEMFGARGRS